LIKGTVVLRNCFLMVNGLKEKALQDIIWKMAL